MLLKVFNLTTRSQVDEKTSIALKRHTQTHCSRNWISPDCGSKKTCEVLIAVDYLMHKYKKIKSNVFKISNYTNTKQYCEKLKRSVCLAKKGLAFKKWTSENR